MNGIGARCPRTEEIDEKYLDEYGSLAPTRASGNG
jgi:hypothetical protein